MTDRPPARSGGDDTLSAWLGTIPPEWLRGCDPDVFATARAAHDVPVRHYHTWHHVVECVERLKSAAAPDPRPIFLALVFHDAVYVAGRADNEDRSASLAQRTLRGRCRLRAQELDSIDRMIRATRDHHALGPALSADERLMLDIDLAILGAPRDAYERYAAAVEREYVPAVTSAAAFRIGRARFLERLLARPRLYLTDPGERRWGAAARANAERELAALRARQGWGGRLVGRLLSAVRKPPLR